MDGLTIAEGNLEDGATESLRYSRYFCRINTSENEHILRQTTLVVCVIISTIWIHVDFLEAIPHLKHFKGCCYDKVLYVDGSQETDQAFKEQ